MYIRWPNKIQLLLCVLLLLVSFWAQGQSIHIPPSTKGEPLAYLLKKLSRKHHIQLAFSEAQLADVQVSAVGHFSSVDTFLSQNLAQKPIGFRKVGPTYVVYKKAQKPAHIRAKLIDKNSGQVIPDAHVFAANNSYCSNDSGLIDLPKQANKTHLRVQHLAYQPLDSLVYLSGRREFTLALTPLVVNLSELVVLERPIILPEISRYQSGKTRLLAQDASHVSTYGGEGVWALLKTLPGIFASHEAPTGYLIKGDLPGQTGFVFEDIRLFELDHFFGNLSGVQPATIKTIDFSNQAQSSAQSGFSGGYFNIQMHDAPQDSLQVSVGLNSISSDFTLGVPLWKGASLTAGGRKSVTNLYQSGYIHKVDQTPEGQQRDSIVNSFSPDFDFYDYNLKFVQYFGQARLKAALFHAEDQQGLSTEMSFASPPFTLSDQESSANKGQSLSFYYPFARNSELNAVFSHSTLLKKNLTELSYPDFTSRPIKDEEYLESYLEEYFVQLNASHKLNHYNQICLGLDYRKLQIGFTESWNDLELDNYQNKNAEYAFFTEFKNNFLPNTEIQLGARASKGQASSSILFDPRLKVNYTHNNKTSAFISINRQTQTSYPLLESEYGNKLQFHWIQADGENYPNRVQWQANLGVEYASKHFDSHILATYRMINNSMEEERYGRQFDGAIAMNSSNELSQINYRYRALEAFAHYRTEKYSAWLSYLLSKSDKSNTAQPEHYVATMSDQRHELKFVQSLRLNDFQLSTNWTLGSGVPLYLYALNTEENSTSRSKNYNRLDISALYTFSYKAITVEAGASILNVFNRENPKFTTSVYSPSISTKGYNFYYDWMSLPRSFSFDLRFRFGLPLKKQGRTDHD